VDDLAGVGFDQKQGFGPRRRAARKGDRECRTGGRKGEEWLLQEGHDVIQYLVSGIRTRTEQTTRTKPTMASSTQLRSRTQRWLGGNAAAARAFQQSFKKAPKIRRSVP
jgi:hypothetical protein